MSRSRPSRPTVDEADQRAPSSAWLFFIVLLIAARYLQPTEAVIFGETLWQAQLWLVGAAVWCWFASRSSRRTLAFSLLDVLVGLMVLGHALATIPIFLEGGDRRAAVNVVWEWAGLAATLFLVRQTLSLAGRGRLISIFTSVMVGIAALGMWQHHVSLRQTAEQYDALTIREAQLTRLTTAGEATPSQQREYAEVRRQLSDFGIPTETAARRQWENRIKFSAEPFGTFGLANTLGGFLAAAIPILVVRLLGLRGWRTATLAVATGMVLYCLILTKSRTAWMSLAVAGAAAFALHFVRGRIKPQTLGLAAAAVALLLAAGAAVLATGGLDREVLSEAPKSLSYRLDYWTGSLAVLRDRPILGTGPANFRSYYLEHRPVGASEEIAAPHNMFLDIWTAGGVLSLAALLALIVKAAIDSVAGLNVSHPPAQDETRSTQSLVTGVAAAYGLVFFVYFISGDGFDWRLAAMAPLAVGVLACQNSANGSDIKRVGVIAALVALIVHLLGADGIEFPAVLQTLLLFALVLDDPRWKLLSKTTSLAATALFGVLAVGCLLTGIVPVLNGGALTSRAMEAYAAGDPLAERLLNEAIEADPLANAPLMLRAQLASARAASSGRAADVVDARRSWDLLLERDPRNLVARRGLAEVLLSSGSSGGAQAAAELLAEAVALSPTDSELRVEAAHAFAKAGQNQQAAEQAAEALRLDDINREAGHTDILLDEGTREEMQAAVGNAGHVP